jgi:predicted NBD/HSP70 family sugar kinase
MQKYVCMDIGGTSLKYGLADAQGNFFTKASMPTEAATKGAASVIEKAKYIVRKYQETDGISGIAVSTAGVVDPETGRILYASENIPGYTGTKLGELLAADSGLPCTVENDVNSAGLGELWLGAAQGAQDVFCLTVGTGIGGCVILHKRLLHGASYSAGEIGYMHIDKTSSLEEMASTKHLVQEVAAQKGLREDAVDGRQVFAWAREKDPIAVAAIDRMVQCLAVGISNICYVLNPELVILGGGIMAQEVYLKPRILKAFQSVTVSNVFAATRIEFARLQNDAGMIGALYNFLQRQGLL